MCDRVFTYANIKVLYVYNMKGGCLHRCGFKHFENSRILSSIDQAKLSKLH